MKQYIMYVILIATILFFWNCSDKPGKIMEAVSVVRVEPSDCMNCKRCITDFECPREAISIVDNKAVVDADKCVSCQLCITDFKCPYNAFKNYADVIPPSVPANFRAEDSTATSVTLSFDDSFDDYNTTNGFAVKYVVKADTVENFDFSNGTEVYSGKDVLQWQEIFNLQSNTIYYFQVVACDEVGNVSQPAKLKVHTMPIKEENQ